MVISYSSDIFNFQMKDLSNAFDKNSKFSNFQKEDVTKSESTDLQFNNCLVSVQNNDLINVGQEKVDINKDFMSSPIFSLNDYKIFRATDICQKLYGGLLQIQINEDTANKVIDISNIDINAEFDSFLKAKGCKNEEELNYLNSLRQEIGEYDDSDVIV